MESLLILLKKLVQLLAKIGTGAALTFAFFMLLPILQVITQPPVKDLTIRTVDVANVPPPPPPPMEEEEPPEPEPEEPPPPAVDAAPLDLSQLELALSPGDGGFGGGDFSVNIGAVAGGGEDVDAIFSLSDLDQKPRVVYQPAPVYPPELARKGMQGTVYVLFLVDKSGRTKDLKVQKSTHPAFNNPALKAVKQWKFEPGKRKGKPVQFRMRVPITFQK
ncbi:energy transducer TonB [Pontiella sp.]|uniref:energy transducer TonB n=1 Tax=Pontiella sp. TaxID=2837462 RepID=UPI00356A8587